MCLAGRDDSRLGVRRRRYRARRPRREAPRIRELLRQQGGWVTRGMAEAPVRLQSDAREAGGMEAWVVNSIIVNS